MKNVHILFPKGNNKTMRPQKNTLRNEPVGLTSTSVALYLHKIEKLQTEIDGLKLDVKNHLGYSQPSARKRERLLQSEIAELRVKNDDLRDEIADLKDENQMLSDDWHSFLRYLSQSEVISPEWRSVERIAQLEILWRESEDSEFKTA